MRTSQKGIDFIKSFEAFKAKAYYCPAGVLTIGYGHTRGVKIGQVITEAQAQELLRQDLLIDENDVNRLVKVPISQNQFDALVSFEFNCGALAVSTLLKKLNAKDYAGAQNEFLKWNKARVNGKLQVLRGLTRRRAAEAKIFGVSYA